MYKGRVHIFECDFCRFDFTCERGFPAGMKAIIGKEIQHVCSECQEKHASELVGKTLKNAGEK